MSADDLLTAADVARLTTLGESTLSDLRARGEGPAWVRLCRRVAYRREDVEAWLAQQTRDGAA